MTSTTLLERSDHWVLPLSGETVIQCCYDYAFTLVVGKSEPSLEIRIEKPFTLSGPDGIADVDPEADPREMASTLRLLRGMVTRAIAHKDGRLEIDFDDGTLVRVPSSSDYEAWTLTGTKTGVMMVSIGGGDLAVWQD